jgi:hypothetical protein
MTKPRDNRPTNARNGALRHKSNRTFCRKRRVLSINNGRLQKENATMLHFGTHFITIPPHAAPRGSTE